MIEPEGKFTNSFLIGENAYLFIFEFGLRTEDGTSCSHSRIVTSPADAEEFKTLLSESLAQHVEKYGPIKRQAPSDEDSDPGDCQRAPGNTNHSVLLLPEDFLK